ncbi:MAG TPA: phage tail assembly protein [Accumulibacter sp.]|nr:phage tail assembly protein [Accumulibacter sp.]
MSGLPPDPDLKPVAAAQAFLDAQTAAAAGAPTRARPVITPAEPERWERVVVLEFPLIVDGDRVDQLQVRCLTARNVADLVIEDDSEGSINLRARALMCGVHPDVLEALSAADAERVAASCRPFLPPSLAALEGLAEDLIAGDLSGAD